MSLATAIARIEEIQGALALRASAPMPPPSGQAAVPTVASGAAPSGAFTSVLAGALASAGVAPGATMAAHGALAPAQPFLTGGAGVGGAIVAIAQQEIGQTEYPPGSNDSPRIATYRQATAGSAVGPWCAYFVSWVARQAGTPIGDYGQGYGRVDDIYAWAQRTGRAIPNGPGVVPRPGDLIVWDEHIGIVEQVLPDGRIQTIEGNSSNAVRRNIHPAGSALGYVRMS